MLGQSGILGTFGVITILVLAEGAKFFPFELDDDPKMLETTTMSDSDPGMGLQQNHQPRRAAGCASKFIPTAMSPLITQKCVDLIGMKMENFPPRREDLVKINYDDMCFSKCYLMEIKYMAPSDNFDRVGIMNMIKQDTPQDKWAAKLQATNKCVKYTEDMAHDEGGVANSPCKYALVFFMCQREVEMKLGC